jgi:hypothetical protein
MFDKLMKVSLLPVLTTLTIGLFLMNLSSSTYDVSSKQIKEDTAKKMQLEQPSEKCLLNMEVFWYEIW